MDYLSDSSVENESPEPADLQRLQAAWKNVKDKKQSERKSVGSVKNAIHLEQQKNLQARLAMTEKQLSKARQNTALLMKKLGEAEQEIQLREFEYNKQKKLREEQEEQIQQLRNLLAKKTKEETFGFQKQNIGINQRQVEAVQKKLQLKEKQIDRLCLKIKSLQLDRQNYSKQTKSLHQMNENLRKQLAESESAMNDAYLGEHSKGAQLLELEEAQKTIQRLVLLLRATEQYRLFGQFAEQVKDLHFLKNIQKRMKTNSLNHRIPERKKICSCMDIKIEQRLLWTPQACYKTMLDMKMKYESLNQDCIEQVLFELNKIWLARQQARVRRVKQTFETEINKLKKKGQIRYDEMVARKQIQRLKKQLSGAKNSKKASKGVSLNNLKNLGQYEDEVRVRDREIKLLQERIRLLQTETGSSDRTSYLQGALWIIERVLGEMQTNEEDLIQFESHFRQKTDDNLSPQDWVRSFKEFFQAITEINKGLVERLFVMKDSTLRKVSGQRVPHQYSRK